jgi:hypothetical protein
VSTVDHVTLDEYEEPNPPNGRRPAPKANPFFRFVFPVVIIASGLAVFLLWREGTKAVLDSTDGTVLEIVTDPGQPGYEVFVDPTPTMLLVHLDDGELVGLTVFAATLLDNGGHAVLVGADVASDGIDGPTFAQRWRTGGMDAVERDLGAMFGFGFVETDAIETPELAQLLSLSEPFPINLLDPLVEVNEDGRTMVFLRAGGQQLDGDAGAELYRWRNPSEFEANRTERQLDLWKSWLAMVGSAADPLSVTLPHDFGLSPFLRAFAAGRADLQILPVVPDSGEAEAAVYSLDDRGREWLADMSDRMVPLRISPIGFPIPTLRLLDGTGDPAVRDSALEALADLSEIRVLGNTAEFGVVATVVTHHRAEAAAAASVIAKELGAQVVFSDEPDQPVDLTVVIGTDWEAP